MFMSRFRVMVSVVLISAFSIVMASQPAIAASKPKTSWEAIQPLLNSGKLDDAKKAIIITLGPVLIGTGGEGLFKNAVDNPSNISCISAGLKIYLDKQAKNQQLTSSVTKLAGAASSPFVPMGPYGPLLKSYLKTAKLSMGAVSKFGNYSQARDAASGIALCLS
jgi:hypothetical protein